LVKKCTLSWASAVLQGLNLKLHFWQNFGDDIINQLTFEPGNDVAKVIVKYISNDRKSLTRNSSGDERAKRDLMI